MNNLIPIERIENKIFLIRGQKVMFDKDLAKLYGVETYNLNKAVKRNLERFPDDFMFSLTGQEFKNLKFHFGISSWGGTRKLPSAFTEQGIAMLSSILRSKRAIQVNIIIMRVFVRLKLIISSHKELAQKLSQLEQKFEKHDCEIQAIFDAIRKLMTPAAKPTRKIGFRPEEK
ncbi:MAG: ORF6N domain-containing protein [Candidatus Saganbacteria bacterium]|nr:ORF6N domain-containing protein [Candidatus Saganbacteria bacterium]